MTRAQDPQFSLADLEFIHQGVQMEPVLKTISDFITEQAAWVERVRRDLERGRGEQRPAPAVDRRLGQ